MNATDTDAATIEPMLEQLIRQHGLATVEAELAILFDWVNHWNELQRVVNIARNVDARLQREKEAA